MAALWASSETYSCAWLVMPALLYLGFFHHREELLTFYPSPTYRGLLATAVALLLWLFGVVIDVNLVQQIAFVAVLIAIIYSALGWQVFRHTAVLWILLLFLIPSGDLFYPPLQHIAVLSIRATALLSGLPWSIDGFTVHVGDLRYVVAPVCAGLNYVILGAFAGYCIGALRSLRPVPAFLTAITGAVLGVMANAIRINAILIQDWRGGTQMELSAHAEQGRLIFLILLGALLFVGLRKRAPAGITASADAVNSGRGAGDKGVYAALAAGLLVAAVSIPFQLAWLGASQHSTAPWELEPLHIAASGNTVAPAEWEIDSAAGIARTTLCPDAGTRVSIQRALTAHATLRAPDLSKEEQSTWLQSQESRTTRCGADQCVRFTDSRWIQQHEAQARHLMLTYFVDDTFTASALVFRVLSGWQKLRGAIPRRGLIAFETPPDAHSADKLARMTLDLHSAL